MLPAGALSNCVNHFHVGNRVIQAGRNCRVFKSRAGKRVGLNGVLVAYIESNCVRSGLIVVPKSRGLIRRSVERNFNFNAPLVSENVHALIGMQLGGARKRGGTVFEFQHSRSQDVGAKPGIYFDSTKYASGLRVEDESRQ